MNELNEPVIVEETYKASMDRVWEAITVRDQMVLWYFDAIEAFEPRVGFETRFNVRVGERDFPHVWKLTEVREKEKLAYDWRYESYPGRSDVAFELSETPHGTKLRLTATVTESFPQDIPEFKRESGVAGWEYFIRSSLKNHLEP